jgi:hypothetical protein
MPLKDDLRWRKHPAGEIILDSEPTKMPRSWWCRGPILAVIIFAALLLNNSDAIFRSPYYESGDYAANSLQVLKAKQFGETLGHYSRFGFHHPGPAFFYVFACGEIIFFDATHLVPTPFNGQLIALYALSAFFFAATLALIAQRLGGAGPLFTGLSLILGASHFGAVGKFYEFIPGYFGMVCPWPPCFVVLPLLCFVVAAASVAAGNGKDLPLMILAACFLVHGHVAMPLFAVPLTLFGYGGFWLETRRRSRQPWKVFPSQHWIAAATIALFLLPIAIDSFMARPSNLERIMEHLRTSYGAGKGLLQSALYFLHFGAYAAYPSELSIPGVQTFDATGMLSFFCLHWRAYGLWLGSILLFVLLRRGEGTASPIQVEVVKFRRWLFGMLIIATGLSLIWGTMQEGPMFDYNSLFNFAIYYGWLLVLTLTAALWIEKRLSACRSRVAQSAVSAALVLVTSAAFIHQRRHFRASLPKDEQPPFAAAMDRALALDPVQPKFFNFDWQAGGETIRVALYLEHRGIRWWVREDWPLFFGAEHIIKPGQPNQPVPTLSSSFWGVALHLSPDSTEGDTRAIVLPLTTKFDLVIHPGK